MVAGQLEELVVVPLDEERLFAAPYFSLMDPAWAEAELERVLAQGARVISMVPGPVPTGAETSVSIGLDRFDGFWSRVNEAGIVVAFHSGDAGYRRFSEAWGGNREFKAFSWDSLVGCLSRIDEAIEMAGEMQVPMTPPPSLAEILEWTGQTAEAPTPVAAAPRKPIAWQLHHPPCFTVNWHWASWATASGH